MWSDKAKLMLEEARRRVDIEVENGNVFEARLYEGRAEALADLLDKCGVAIDPWKPRPDVKSEADLVIQSARDAIDVQLWDVKRRLGIAR